MLPRKLIRGSRHVRTRIQCRDRGCAVVDYVGWFRRNAGAIRRGADAGGEAGQAGSDAGIPGRRGRRGAEAEAPEPDADRGNGRRGRGECLRRQPRRCSTPDGSVSEEALAAAVDQANHGKSDAAEPSEAQTVSVQDRHLCRGNGRRPAQETRSRSELESRIAELEAVIARSAAEFEPDGSEAQMIDARSRGVPPSGRQRRATEAAVSEESARAELEAENAASLECDR